MIFKSKQILTATLIVALGAAVAVNWYYTNSPENSEEITTQAVSGNLGDSLYVGGTTAAPDKKDNPTGIIPSTIKSGGFFSSSDKSSNS